MLVADIALSTAVKYVAAAYAVVWLLVLLYVWILRSKYQRLEGEVVALEERLAERVGARRRARADHRHMRLVAVGLSHHRAGVGLRGRVALAEPEARCLVQNLAQAGAREAVVLSTCNRTELYLAGPDAAELTTLGVRELSELVGVDPRELEPVLYRLTDATAALHLNRVAAGLDSLVPGEAQVLGQVRAALRDRRVRGHGRARALARVPARARDGQARAQRDRRSRRATPRSPRSPRASPTARSEASRAARRSSSAPAARRSSPRST